MKFLNLVAPLELGQYVYTARIMGGREIEKVKEKAKILAIDGDKTLVQFQNDLPEIVIGRRLKSDLFDIIR